MPLLIPSSLQAVCALTFSFFTIASTLSLNNESQILRDPRFPLCFTPPTPPRSQPLSELECGRALEIFTSILQSAVTPILTHDNDKAHLREYLVAPLTAVDGECMFGADIPTDQDAPVNTQSLIYHAQILLLACVGKAEYDGGRSCVEVPRTATWINIDFRY